MHYSYTMMGYTIIGYTMGGSLLLFAAATALLGQTAPDRGEVTGRVVDPEGLLCRTRGSR